MSEVYIFQGPLLSMSVLARKASSFVTGSGGIELSTNGPKSIRQIRVSKKNAFQLVSISLAHCGDCLGIIEPAALAFADMILCKRALLEPGKSSCKSPMVVFSEISDAIIIEFSWVLIKTRIP